MKRQTITCKERILCLHNHCCGVHRCFKEELGPLIGCLLEKRAQLVHCKLIEMSDGFQY